MISKREKGSKHTTENKKAIRQILINRSELNAVLEYLARLIDAGATSAEDAARLVRESKIKA